MKTIIFTLILLINTTLTANQATVEKPQESEENIKEFAETMHKLLRKPTEAEQQARDLYAQWSGQLTDYLLNHEQPYAQVIGLNEIQAMVETSAGQDNQEDIVAIRQNYADHINRLVKDEALNIETYQILEALCFKIELDGYCDRQALLDKQIKLYPNQLSVYFQPLQLAIQSGNNELAANLMKVMSGTQQMTQVDYLLPEFITLIKDYTKTNPIPEKSLLREKNDLLATQDMSDKQIALMHEKMPEAQVYITLIGMQMALPIPQYQVLKEACQNNPEYSAECLYIAKIMIHKGNTVVTKAIGHIINMAVYELNNQQDMLLASQANHERFKQHVKCLGKNQGQNNKFIDDYFDNDYAELWLTAEHELDRQFNIANYLYKKRLSEDAENPLDPATCNVQ